MSTKPFILWKQQRLLLCRSAAVVFWNRFTLGRLGYMSVQYRPTTEMGHMLLLALELIVCLLAKLRPQIWRISALHNFIALWSHSNTCTCLCLCSTRELNYRFIICSLCIQNRAFLWESLTCTCSVYVLNISLQLTGFKRDFDSLWKKVPDQQEL